MRGKGARWQRADWRVYSSSSWCSQRFNPRGNRTRTRRVLACPFLATNAQRLMTRKERAHGLKEAPHIASKPALATARLAGTAPAWAADARRQRSRSRSRSIVGKFCHRRHRRQRGRAHARRVARGGAGFAFPARAQCAALRQASLSAIASSGSQRASSPDLAQVRHARASCARHVATREQGRRADRERADCARPDDGASATARARRRPGRAAGPADRLKKSGERHSCSRPPF